MDIEVVPDDVEITLWIGDRNLFHKLYQVVTRARVTTLRGHLACVHIQGGYQ